MKHRPCLPALPSHRSTGGAWRKALIAGGLLAGFASSPAAHAVTGVSVDGRPDPVMLTVGETVTVRWDVAKTGGTVQQTLVRDISGTGKYDPAYPFHVANPIVDGGAADSDPAPSKIALLLPVTPTMPAGRYVMHLSDRSDGSSVVSPVWTVRPKPEAQAISGRVAVVSDANPAGTPPPDAIVWAAKDLQTLVASANIKPDGSYTLPVPPGTYVLFAEWFGNLRSQRQICPVAAGQSRDNVNLPLLQGYEVTGTVSVGGQPASDALVQATGADGRVLSARTFADGTYALILPRGTYRITAPGGSETVPVVDGPVGGVDFPAPAAAPQPAVGTIVTAAGSGSSVFGGDGRTATAAGLPNPISVTVDTAGNLYVADNVLNRVRKVDAKSGIITTVAGSSTIDAIRFLTPQAGSSGGFSGDGGPATAALLNSAQHVTVAGGGTGAVADGAKATEVALNRPRSLALDGAGNLFIGDGGLIRIVKVSPAGVLSLVAGNGTAGFSGDGGPAMTAQFNAVFPNMAVDRAGNLYFVDISNQRVRKVSAEGVISTVVGNGEIGFAPDGTPAAVGRLSAPVSVTIDRDGNLYVVENGNKRIRKVIGIAAPGIIAGQ